MMTRFVTITADPPWPYKDRLSMADVKRAAGAHYPTMSVSEIRHLAKHYPIRLAGHRVAADAFLWLWVTNPFLLDGTGAAVCRAWGFEPRQLVTWVKGRIEVAGARAGQFIPQIGMGHFTRGATEHLILATRGGGKHLVQDRGVPNVFIAPRTTHSTKPDAAYSLIQRVSPGPYLELFARKPRENFVTWGNEVTA